MAAVTNDRDLSVLWGKLEMTNGDMRGLLGEWLHPQREGVSAVYLRLSSSSCGHMSARVV